MLSDVRGEVPDIDQYSSWEEDQGKLCIYGHRRNLGAQLEPTTRWTLGHALCGLN